MSSRHLVWVTVASSFWACAAFADGYMLNADFSACPRKYIPQTSATEGPYYSKEACNDRITQVQRQSPMACAKYTCPPVGDGADSSATGPLIVPHDPGQTAGNIAKQYVQSAPAPQNLQQAGATMTQGLALGLGVAMLQSALEGPSPEQIRAQQEAEEQARLLQQQAEARAAEEADERRARLMSSMKGLGVSPNPSLKLSDSAAAAGTAPASSNLAALKLGDGPDAVDKSALNELKSIAAHDQIADQTVSEVVASAQSMAGFDTRSTLTGALPDAPPTPRATPAGADAEVHPIDPQVVQRLADMRQKLQANQADQEKLKGDLNTLEAAPQPDLMKIADVKQKLSEKEQEKNFLDFSIDALQKPDAANQPPAPGAAAPSPGSGSGTAAPAAAQPPAAAPGF